MEEHGLLVPNANQIIVLSNYRISRAVSFLALKLGSLNADEAFAQKTVYELTRLNWDQLTTLLREMNYPQLPI